jgi:hypothetical protein
MCPLAIASYFWYKFYASLLAARYFCSRALYYRSFQG